MATASLPVASPLHAGAAAFTRAAAGVERRVGLLFIGTGLALVALMGLLGLTMRLSQATVITIGPAWFYRILTLHGVGMITGALLAMMGASWYVLHATVPLRGDWMAVTYGLTVLGVLAVLIATLVGGFGASWTFLPPLPFHPAGQWPVWSESVFFVGNLLVGAGFFVFCLGVLEQTTTRYRGLAGALGWRYLRGHDEEAPPPQAIAFTVVAIDGLLASAVGSSIVLGLLGHTYDHTVGVDALAAKNLVYFFGHSLANLGIYLAAGVLYVLVPRYAGRPYQTSKPFVFGWTSSLVFIVTGYSHHLYMDFVQPNWAQVISEITSYTALLPVAVITIYSMTMLVWGAEYRWTLASTLLYIGLGGWAIGGVGAVIDSLIPLNFRLHNTVWVVAHFHTYELLSVVVWVLAFLAHLLERDAGVTSSRVARVSTVGLLLVGGYGLTGTWFVEGTLGIPRRYAIQPPGTSGYSTVGAGFALLLALGFLLFFAQLAPLARTAWSRRHASPVEAETTPAAPAPPSGVPLATPTQLGFGVAACVVALAAFFPQVVDASEAVTRYHHLDHAGHFFFGAMLGLTIGSAPAIARRLGQRPCPSLGLAAVLTGTTSMMLVMVPRFYEPLERHPLDHALYHIAMAACGLVTGLGATRLGFVAGRLAFALAIGMPLMFAAAMR